MVATFHTGGHSSRVRTMVRGAQSRGLRLLLRRANGSLAVCRFEVETFARYLGLEPERIRLIPHWSGASPVWRFGARLHWLAPVSSVARLERSRDTIT